MDNQRLLVWALFLMLAWITWQQWVEDYAPQPAQQPPAAIDEPQPEAVDLPELGDVTVAPGDVDAPDVMPSVDGQVEQPTAASAPTVRVTTDVLDLEISLEGGTLQGATLLNYPVAKDRPDDLVKLLETDPNRLGLLQTGLRSAGEGPEPNHRAMFTSTRTSFDLGSADELVYASNRAEGVRRIDEGERVRLRTINFLLFDHIGGLNTLLHTLFTGNQVGPTAKERLGHLPRRLQMILAATQDG